PRARRALPRRRGAPRPPPPLARPETRAPPTARFAATVRATSATACPTFRPLPSSQPNPGLPRSAMRARLAAGHDEQRAERSNGHRAFERRLVHRLTGAGIDDRAAIHHREMVPQLAREVEILLDQHHGDLAEIAQIGDSAADVLDDRGLNTLSRLIEQKQARPHDERPADRELLLLAAGQIAAAPPQHVVEHWKQREHVVGDRAILALERRKAGLEVLLDGEERKDFTSLGHVGDAAPRALAGLEPGN